MTGLFDSHWIPLSRAISLVGNHPVDKAKRLITSGLQNGEIRSFASVIKKYRLSSIEYDFKSETPLMPDSVAELLGLDTRHVTKLLKNESYEALSVGLHDFSDEVEQLVVDRGKTNAVVYMSSGAYEPVNDHSLAASFWYNAKIGFDESIAISYQLALRTKQIAYGLALNKHDVEHIEANDISATEVPTTRQSPNRPRKKAGRKPNALWEDALIEAAEYMFREGRPTSITPVVDHVLRWLQEQKRAWYEEKAADRPEWADPELGSEHARGPGAKTVREHIQPLYEALQSMDESSEDLLIEIAAAMAALGTGATEDETLRTIAAEFPGDSKRVQLLSPQIRKLHQATKRRLLQRTD